MGTTTACGAEGSAQGDGERALDEVRWALGGVGVANANVAVWGMSRAEIGGKSRDEEEGKGVETSREG